ncbi:MAG: putative glycoside hydrolase [Gemmatimonadaceae bacterium]|jgi:hypothetical protein|nr:putative glycoside hydrolase [Gemmatimonadaceae bacterium]
MHRHSCAVPRAAASLAVVALPLLAACGSGDTTAGRGTTPNGASRDSAPTSPPVATRPARTPRPDSVRALYVNGWAAGSYSRMAEILRIADATEINAIIVDIKESDSYLTYSGTAIPEAKSLGTDQRPATKWMPALVDSLRAHNLYAIARIVVFKDRMVAEKKPEWAIQHVNGGLWRDRKGLAWVNPYHRSVWDYNMAIAKEAIAMGFGEVQWDYVRFPDVTDNMRKTMAFPGSEGRSRAENIGAFLRWSKEQLAPLGVRVAADVFGLVTHLEGDVEIGQHWETVIAEADVVLPMTYPSHYYAGLYGFARPGQHPYEILRLAATDAAERTRFFADSTKRPVAQIMPWLEAMSIRGLSYGPAELRRQIQGVYDAGLTSWALWSPGSKFAEFEPALRPASGGLSPLEKGGWTAPKWTLPRERLSVLIRKRERRAVPIVGDSVPASKSAGAGSARP